MKPACIPAKDDPSRFVQKSVANMLNDIIKDNPEIALDTIETWINGATPNRNWIIKHALRILKKKKDQRAEGILLKLSAN